MRAIEAQAKGMDFNASLKPIDNGIQEFGKVLGNFVNDVDTVKLQSERLQDALVQGDPTVTVPQVMIASEKAGLQVAFLTEVVNKCIGAYNEISRMGV